MNRTPLGTLALWLSCTVAALAQPAGFDSFVSRLSSQYRVDVAIAPELIPMVDSILDSGKEINSLGELISLLVLEENLSYQVLDGNKLMLRRERHPPDTHKANVVEGTILSGEDGTPLAFAAVGLMHTTRGCLTDENGHFSLSVSDTAGYVQISYLGYRGQTIPISTFLGGKHRVHLKVQDVPLEEITIIIPNKDFTLDPGTQALQMLGYQLLSEEELMRGNVERMINTLTTYTHFSSDEGIRIRGSDAENALILMDGLPVYDPYHFYNIFSPFNPHYFSSITLYKNNLPVAYGGRIDGMVQLESDRRRPKSHLLLDSDLLLTSMESQWVLQPEWVLKLGGRISHTDILNDALSDSTIMHFDSPGRFQDDNEWTAIEKPDFSFYDINAGLTKWFPNGSKAYATFFTSRDKLEKITATAFETSGHMNHETISVQQTYSNRDVWKNKGIIVGTGIIMDAKTHLTAETFASRYEKDISYFNERNEIRDLHQQRSANTGYQQNELMTYGLKGWLKKTTSPGSLFQAGLDMQFHEASFQAKENLKPYASGSQRETEHSLFGEYHRKLWSSLDLYVGSRWTYLRSTSRFYFLPNLRTTYFLDDHVHLRAAFSGNLQTVYEITVENRFRREQETLALSDPEAGYPVMQSDKYMFGTGYHSIHFSADVEFFYKKTSGLTRIAALKPDPGFHDPSTPDDFYQLLLGEAWAAGIDINMFFKKGRWDGALYYSLSKMAERYDRLFKGNFYSPEEDRRHQIKFSGKYKIGSLETSLLVNYKSKAPYISLIRLEGKGGIDVINPETVTSYLPPYFSIDMGADYSFKLCNQPAQIGISVINVTNHTNIADLQHIGRVSRDMGEGSFYITQQTELLGRTGNVHFRIML